MCIRYKCISCDLQCILIKFALVYTYILIYTLPLKKGKNGSTFSEIVSVRLRGWYPPLSVSLTEDFLFFRRCAQNKMSVWVIDSCFIWVLSTKYILVFLRFGGYQEFFESSEWVMLMLDVSGEPHFASTLGPSVWQLQIFSFTSPRCSLSKGGYG